MRQLLLLALLCVAGTAVAAPVNRRVEVAPGSAGHIEPLGRPARVHLEPAGLVSAEVLPSGEVLIEPTASGGSALLFLHGLSWMRVWRVDVGSPERDAEAARSELARACPGSLVSRRQLAIRVSSAACVERLVALGSFHSDQELQVDFDADGLQAQLTANRAVLDREHPKLSPALKMAYLGGTLRLTGSLPTQADLEAVIRTLWKTSAGKFLLDANGLELVEKPAKPVEAPAAAAEVETVEVKTDPLKLPVGLDDGVELADPGTAGDWVAGDDEEDDEESGGDDEEAGGVEVIRGFDPDNPPD